MSAWQKFTDYGICTNRIEETIWLHGCANLLEEWVESWMKKWAPPTAEPPICSRSPRAEGDTTVMQRAMCPWESRVDFDETREPKIVSEAVCLCRRSRGATGAFCLPIKRE
ncbi:hypothetical protein OSTOST_22147, partial [Ostertagia ostertagi]